MRDPQLGPERSRAALELLPQSILDCQLKSLAGPHTFLFLIISQGFEQLEQLLCPSPS